jgi:hypothetical protein
MGYATSFAEHKLSDSKTGEPERSRPSPPIHFHGGSGHCYYAADEKNAARSATVTAGHGTIIDITLESSSSESIVATGSGFAEHKDSDPETDERLVHRRGNQLGCSGLSVAHEKTAARLATDIAVAGNGTAIEWDVTDTATVITGGAHLPTSYIDYFSWHWQRGLCSESDALRLAELTRPNCHRDDSPCSLADHEAGMLVYYDPA